MNGQTTSWNDTQKLLAFIVVVAFIAVILLWMFFPPHSDQASLSVLNMLVGALVGMASMVATFYFGSSRGERTKDAATTAATAASATSTTTTTAAPATEPIPPAAPVG